MRVKRARRRGRPVEVIVGDQQLPDEWRGRIAWHMTVGDLRLGHYLLGFDYEVNGDTRPRRRRAVVHLDSRRP